MAWALAPFDHPGTLSVQILYSNVKALPSDFRFLTGRRRLMQSELHVGNDHLRIIGIRIHAVKTLEIKSKHVTIERYAFLNVAYV